MYCGTVRSDYAQIAILAWHRSLYVSRETLMHQIYQEDKCLSFKIPGSKYARLRLRMLLPVIKLFFHCHITSGTNQAGQPVLRRCAQVRVGLSLWMVMSLAF